LVYTHADRRCDPNPALPGGFGPLVVATRLINRKSAMTWTADTTIEEAIAALSTQSTFPLLWVRN